MLDAAYLGDLITVILNGTPFLDLDRALPLLLGTAAQESHLRYTRQLSGGPARGYWQLEPATERSHWAWIAHQPLYARAIRERSGVEAASVLHLEYNLPYQILMARLHYHVRDPQRLPAADDLAGQAACWKQYYNTVRGRGTVAQYCASWIQYIVPHVRLRGSGAA